VDSIVNFVKHAETYRYSGIYGSEVNCMGDAMPLALANVLGMTL
jgi:hypothetical protein